MSNETETARVPAAAVNAAEIQSAAGVEELKLFDDDLRLMFAPAVKDLLSLGVCVRCILRFLGVHAHGSVFSSVSTSALRNLLVGDEDKGSYLAADDFAICNVCLGILQFSYSSEKKMLEKKESPSDFAQMIAELVKQEGHEIDSFSLEVSVPPVILDNERAVCSYLKGKYGSEVWLRERSPSEGTLVKDSLKTLVLNQLEKSLGLKSGVNSFRIRLTYTTPSKKHQSSTEKNHGSKRRKTETENGLNTSNANECSDFPACGANEDSRRTSNDVVDLVSSNGNELSLEKVNEPCHLAIQTYQNPIYFCGRYLKFSRKVSQTRWIIDDERMGEASVEEILGGNILPMCRGDNYKFHAAGREDIDVRMLGSGRPFLVEIQNPRQIPSVAFVKEIEEKINNLENRLVGVKNLKVVGSQGWALMREGEAEKQKQYAALVWIPRPLEDEDVEKISSLKELKVLQRTPIRVLHRRSPLDREKIIHWMKIEKISGSSQYFLLHLCTQAGTYIKEFVHGDLGRTQPSIGSILGCTAEILRLDVTDVKMDCFLDV